MRVNAPPVAVTVAAVSVTAVADGVPVALSDHAPSPPAVVAATRMVYWVLFVRPVSVARVLVVTTWRLAASQFCAPDFHCTL